MASILSRPQCVKGISLQVTIINWLSDGLMQDCSKSNALAQDLLQICAKPLNFCVGRDES